VALACKFLRIEAGAQQANDDERARMRGHRAHQEVEVARGDVVVVLAHEVIEGLRAVAMLVVAVPIPPMPAGDSA
jgi:hypothetical protein